MSYDASENIKGIMADVLKPKLVETVERAPGMSRQEFRRKQREANTRSESGGLDRRGLPRQPIPTIVLVDCPKCGKHRHSKYLGEDGKVLSVSNETADVRGETRLLDVCGVCNAHYRASDEKFIMSNLKKIQKAMRERRLNPTNDKDFSIDL